MTIEEEVLAYLAGIHPDNVMIKLKLLATRPTLKQRRMVRPRVGILRQLIASIQN